MNLYCSFFYSCGMKISTTFRYHKHSNMRMMIWKSVSVQVKTTKLLLFQPQFTRNMSTAASLYKKDLDNTSLSVAVTRAFSGGSALLPVDTSAPSTSSYHQQEARPAYRPQTSLERDLDELSPYLEHRVTNASMSHPNDLDLIEPQMGDPSLPTNNSGNYIN